LFFRVALSVFIAVVGPFGFFNVTKTKYLQMLTTVMRWLAFGSMVTLACVRLADGIRADPPPPVASFSGVPNLFGVCVYSFMCHHSLPSLVTPIDKKRNINWLIASDFLLVLMFYMLLAFTGIFAFSELNDLYTLNFAPVKGEVWYLAVVHYFLSLFPVFTLSTNFPIITITLRNNLKALFLTEGKIESVQSSVSDPSMH
jgi:amino acid permease